MSEKPVWLGLPGDFVDASADAYTTKIGGTPILPDGVTFDESVEAKLKCGSCGKHLALLSQVSRRFQMRTCSFRHALVEMCPGDVSSFI